MSKTMRDHLDYCRGGDNDMSQTLRDVRDRTNFEAVSRRALFMHGRAAVVGHLFLGFQVDEEKTDYDLHNGKQKPDKKPWKVKLLTTGLCGSFKLAEFETEREASTELAKYVSEHNAILLELAERTNCIGPKDNSLLLPVTEKVAGKGVSQSSSPNIDVGTTVDKNSRTK